jgi:2,3-bisphosphoglycerate-independent phosphoglycerate mutase
MPVEKQRVVLTILDGFGYRSNMAGNAVEAARKPHFDRLKATFPWTLMEASGPWVGLPPGQMGNSEVGHLNIGAGRVIQMDVSRIDYAIHDGSFFTNAALKSAMTGGRLHLLGLLSDGGVHSMNTHLYALLAMAKREGLKDVFIHAFIDGRDTPPNAGLGYLRELQAKIKEIGIGQIASICGRYYAMDRDKRWERTKRSYDAIVHGSEGKGTDPLAAIQASYEKGVTDEFIEPVTFTNTGGLIRENDSVIFFNYRADRGRQLTQVFTQNAVPEIQPPKLKAYVMMTDYDRTYKLPYAFGPETHQNILGDVLAAHNRRNLRTAETEKYPHVTYFFNGGDERVRAGEEREVIASPKVATYDLQPEMNAAQVCDVVVKGITQKDFDLIVVNFANPDMVGHTGVFQAAVQAVEACDACLGRIWQALQDKPAAWIVTADHGNSEIMVDPHTGQPHTYHTTSPVPLIYAANQQPRLRSGGALRDIAPTILSILGIEKPAEMTGADLRLPLR